MSSIIRVTSPNKPGTGKDPNDACDDPGYRERLDELARTSTNDGWPVLGDPFAKVSPVPFPLDVLPPDVGGYVADQADRMGADAGMLAMFGLGALAAAITDEIQIQPKSSDPSWRESPRLWIAAVGNPSILKSPALKAMLIPLKEYDAVWAEEEEKAHHEYSLAEKLYRKQEAAYVHALFVGNEAAKPIKPKPPLIPRALVEDHTVEALGQILTCTPRGTLCIFDELSGFFGGMDAYRERGVTKDRAHYLELYNGGPRRIDRVNRGTMFVPNWGVSILGGIQPAPMRKIASNIQDDGLLQRFNVIVASDAQADNDRPRDDAAFKTYSDLVKGLFELQGANGLVKFAKDAVPIWEEFTEFVRTVSTIDTLPQQIRTHIGKWRGQFARIALVFHVVECSIQKIHPLDASQVSAETAERTYRLFKTFLLPHALVFYHDVVGQNEVIEEARWLAGLILSKQLEKIDRRTIKAKYRKLRGASDWQIHKAMDSLDMFGWVKPVKGEIAPVRRWDINPAVHQRFMEKAVEERDRRAREREVIAKIFKRTPEKQRA